MDLFSRHVEAITNKGLATWPSTYRIPNIDLHAKSSSKVVITNQVGNHWP